MQFYKVFLKSEILTVVKDSVIDLGSLPQSHSLLHHCGNSIFVPVCRGNETLSANWSFDISKLCLFVWNFLEIGAS